MKHRHTSTPFTAIRVVKDKVMAKAATDAIAVARKAIGPAIAPPPRSSLRARARVSRERARVFRCGTARADKGGKGRRDGSQDMQQLRPAGPQGRAMPRSQKDRGRRGLCPNFGPSDQDPRGNSRVWLGSRRG